MATRTALDRLGATGSFACAVHCALLPIAITLAPSLGLAAWFGEHLERGLVIFASVLGTAMVGWNCVHSRTGRSIGPLLLALAALWSGTFWPELHDTQWLHAAVMAFGGTMMAWAHWHNLRRHGDGTLPE